MNEEQEHFHFSFGESGCSMHLQLLQYQLPAQLPAEAARFHSSSTQVTLQPSCLLTTIPTVFLLLAVGLATKAGEGNGSPNVGTSFIRI